MLPSPFQNALVLTGPTGSGKTALGVELAEKLGAEIVSMDSMALYRGMDIGTAKPGSLERWRVRHHLLDVLEPWESASVAWWLQQAAATVRVIEARASRALFVGGTPLYLKALLYGLFKGPPASPQLRRRLTAEAERNGAFALHQRLAQIDPAAAAHLHPHDLRRIIRALEVWELTGKPISAWQTQWSNPRTQATDYGLPTADQVLCLDVPRPDLYTQINARVRQMFARGLVEEVRALRALPQGISREAAQALGYKETLEYLGGRQTLVETIDRIQTRSRNFAKRQLTWFRHLPDCRMVTRELTFAAWNLTMDD
jgi:tRNA dimethylallyltransferase